MKSKKAWAYLKAMERDYNAYNKMINSTVARQALQMSENDLEKKIIEAHRHACPIRIYRMFCPHAEQREKRTSEECPMNCDYMTRFKEEIDSIR